MTEERNGERSGRGRGEEVNAGEKEMEGGNNGGRMKRKNGESGRDAYITQAGGRLSFKLNAFLNLIGNSAT